MKPKEKLIYLEMILIMILLISMYAMQTRIIEFKRDCRETFNVNASCPCEPSKLNSLNITGILNKTFGKIVEDINEANN